jgi:alkylation response protein AidB-like acyl-CoA dehydrogenase
MAKILQADWPEDTREALLDRAAALVPALKERAADCEAARCVPVESVAAFKQAGLIRMTQPRRFGGAAQGWDVLCETSTVLATGDGAQAWIAAIMADHAQMLGCFPLEAQEDVWGADPEAVMSASFDPVGRARPEDGGFRFTGAHNFASGVDHADWVICGGFIIDGARRDGPHFFLIPRGDGRIVDDWDTVGLEGTGSKTFAVENAFVPAHRRLDGALARAGTPPGAEINPDPVYRLPRGGLTSTIFAALSVGMARGLLDEWLAYTSGRISHGQKMAEDPGSRFIAGQASAELAAAEALNLNAVRGGMAVLASGRRMSDEEIVMVKRDAAFAAQMAIGAGTRVFNAAGGRAIFRKSDLQRRYRNLMVGASHFSISWDRAAIAAGAALLGK